MKKPHFRTDVVKFTDDDWYGNYSIMHKGVMTKTVQVTYVPLALDQDAKRLFRVCVWGNDDFGLERDYEDRRAARRAFSKIVDMYRVNKNELKDMGFQPC